jgi:hypothetical protein
LRAGASSSISARTTGRQLIVLDPEASGDIEPAFANFVQRGAGALLVGSPVTAGDRHRSPARVLAPHRAVSRKDVYWIHAISITAGSRKIWKQCHRGTSKPQRKSRDEARTATAAQLRRFDIP